MKFEDRKEALVRIAASVLGGAAARDGWASAERITGMAAKIAVDTLRKIDAEAVKADQDDSTS